MFFFLLFSILSVDFKCALCVWVCVCTMHSTTWNIYFIHRLQNSFVFSHLILGEQPSWIHNVSPNCIFIFVLFLPQQQKTSYFTYFRQFNSSYYTHTHTTLFFNIYLFLFPLCHCHFSMVVWFFSLFFLCRCLCYAAYRSFGLKVVNNVRKKKLNGKKIVYIFCYMPSCIHMGLISGMRSQVPHHFLLNMNFFFVADRKIFFHFFPIHLSLFSWLCLVCMYILCFPLG